MEKIKQIYIYSVSTDDFYNKEESVISKELIKARHEKSKLAEIARVSKKLFNKPDDMKKSEINKLQRAYDKALQTVRLNNLYEKSETDIDDLQREYVKKEIAEIAYYHDLAENYLMHKDGKYVVNKESAMYERIKGLKENIDELKTNLETKLNTHTKIRELNPESVANQKDVQKREQKFFNKKKTSNKIGQFESILSRTLGIEEGKTTKDFIVVRIYHHSVLYNLLKKGFTLDGEHYRYLMSSAGMIRNKKATFIKSSVWRKHKNTLMCGLSISEINKKGGVNTNKLNAYLSLILSSSVKWEGFEKLLDKSIVVDDFETTLFREVDLIDDETYEIERVERHFVKIPHMDGAGMILPQDDKEIQKSFQFRMPFFKGLLIPFQFDKFIQEKCNGKCVVRDIFGVDHDILEEGIQIVFTKSQFKMHSFFSGKDGWERYKRNFKEFGCHAAKCKEAEDDFEDKPLSYQVLQSLNEMKTEDLEEFTSDIVKLIKGLGDDEEVMAKVITNKHTDYYKAIQMYPAMLTDSYSKQLIKDKKKSLVQDAKAGKILLKGTKRTYIAPDLYAFCEWLFLKKEKPKGLLSDGKVSCRLYGNQKLDILRSPHNYREHAIKRNIRNKATNEWFITNDMYTSTHDTISKVLQFDVDGDDCLIVCNKRFIEIAEEHMKDIVPLEYKLATSEPEKVTSNSIYNGLIAAYKADIGGLANLICKIWNTKEPNLKVIKWLCFESNATIDFAKTLWMPKRPPEVDKEIKKYINMKMPYFFVYAKGKKEERVQEINDSVVNQLDEIIPDKNIHFSKITDEKFDYKMLMKNKRIEINSDIIALFNEKNQNKHNAIKEQLESYDGDHKTHIKLPIYEEIRERFKNSGKDIGKDLNYVTDVLVKYLYGISKSEHKSTLWYCFGDILLRNLDWNLNNKIDCLDCGIEIVGLEKRKERCECCQKERNKEKATLRKQKQRSKGCHDFVQQVV